MIGRFREAVLCVFVAFSPSFLAAQGAQSIETAVVSSKTECLELGQSITGPYG